MALNGSPRKKKWNTNTLLKEALKGAASVGVETELIQLYDLKSSGCISSFSCKRIRRKEDGICAVQDDMTSVLGHVKNTDSLIMGTPVYY
jgi:multimeric flavodoxin WrbA